VVKVRRGEDLEPFRWCFCQIGRRRHLRWERKEKRKKRNSTKEGKKKKKGLKKKEGGLNVKERTRQTALRSFATSVRKNEPHPEGCWGREPLDSQKKGKKARVARLQDQKSTTRRHHAKSEKTASVRIPRANSRKKCKRLEKEKRCVWWTCEGQHCESTVGEEGKRGQGSPTTIQSNRLRQKEGAKREGDTLTLETFVK